MGRKAIDRFYVELLLFISLISYSCTDKENTPEISKGVLSPILKSLIIKATVNPDNLIEDIYGKIIGDSIVECWIPYMVPNKLFCVEIDAEGKATLDGVEFDSLVKHDFSKPVLLSIENDLGEKEYKIYVHTFTGLPIVWIETEGRKEIVSKVDYQKASFRLEDGVITKSAGDADAIVDSVYIKGRGSSSWTKSPKKSYRLKFDKKLSLLNEPKDKSWVMVANYFDKTMLRNVTAYFMGKLSNLDYTPNFHFVELFFNGQYDGTYMLGDKLKIGKDRVNVGDDGFLLEVDQRAVAEGDIYFYSERIAQPFNIKDPDVEKGDDNYEFIRNYILETEKVLFSDMFLDPNEGWQKYMDIDSFADWYVIHEITKCADPLWFYTSCYMNKTRTGKLKMGPLWDFDLTMGNSSNPDIWPVEGIIRNVSMGSPWYERLFEDPLFVAKVKERFNYFYSKKTAIMEEINAKAIYLNYSIVENNYRWNNMYTLTFAGHDVLGSYYNEVQYLKNWLNNRFDWLKIEFEKY